MPDCRAPRAMPVENSRAYRLPARAVTPTRSGMPEPSALTVSDVIIPLPGLRQHSTSPTLEAVAREVIVSIITVRPAWTVIQRVYMRQPARNVTEITIRAVGMGEETELVWSCPWRMTTV